MARRRRPRSAPLPIAPGHEAPLPIAVRTPQDLAFKTEVERQYLIVNLMAGGRIGYEAGDFARAVRDWEALFKIPNLPPEIARVGGAAARRRATPARRGGRARRPPIAAPHPGGAARRRSRRRPAGAAQPDGQRHRDRRRHDRSRRRGGLVEAARWSDAAARAAARQRVVNQLSKTFVPHVLAIGVGDSVSFRNDDPYFHNVFSLSAGQGFDAGLYAAGRSYAKTFTRPGPVELLCNIHASMLGYIYVVDSAYYTQPRPSGAFTIRNVPPGATSCHAWHESAASIVKQTVTVGAGGASGIVVRIPGDRAPMVIVPDKYGKPRQTQLGY